MTLPEKAEKPKRKRVSYSRALAIEICDRIANGETLRQIGSAAGMPNRITIIQWANRDIDGFETRYAKARNIHLHLLADEIVDIADDGTNDWVERETRNGTEIALDKEHILRSRTRIDARKWILSKLLPEKYGDKLAVDHKSGPVEVNHTHMLKLEDLKAMSIDELAQFYREKATEAGEDQPKS
jgi:hypothetical protein